MPPRTWPHCDARVLHAPGECEFCDGSGLQDVREMWGINFTGHHEPGLLLCPAEAQRDLSQINAWPGNAPSVENDIRMIRAMADSFYVPSEEVIQEAQRALGRMYERLRSHKVT